MMRITGGIFKGRQIKTIPGQATRPTADKVKQAIFNILMHDIEDAYVLDLFAGTGALGIEALSRGARKAVFVDNGFKQASAIRNNLKTLELVEMVLEKKCEAACEMLHMDDEKFDLIFADPPYKYYRPIDIAELISQYDLLSENGLLIIEHDANHTVENEWLALLKTRKFGKTAITFFTRKGN